MLSIPDMALLGAAALMFFGPEQLPKVARKVGILVRDVQNTSQQFIREMERAADEGSYSDISRAHLIDDPLSKGVPTPYVPPAEPYTAEPYTAERFTAEPYTAQAYTVESHVAEPYVPASPQHDVMPPRPPSAPAPDHDLPP